MLYEEFLQISKKKTTHTDNIGKTYKQCSWKLKTYIKYNNEK